MPYTLTCFFPLPFEVVLLPTTELVPSLLDLVDEGRIAFRPAVELSYLKKEEQEDLLEEISYADATPSLAQAIKMKRFSQEGLL